MRRRILMVDDDPSQVDLVSAYFKSFRSEPFDFVAATSYDEGIQRLLSGEFAACLLDYRLGERDGLQLMREAINRGCRTPIIFLTGESGSGIDIEAMNAGALDYLVKGEITVPTLERSLRYALKLGETLDALNRLATHDTLTGLPNRREFDRILSIELARADRFKLPFSLAIADVDLFKPINDTHGHPAGDAVLRQVAERLRDSVRPMDLVSRIGGEEFGIMFVQAEGPAALQALERVRLAMVAEPIMARPELALFVTVSAGLASFPKDGRTPLELIASADKALYAAKAAGRNRVIAFGSQP